MKFANSFFGLGTTIFVSTAVLVLGSEYERIPALLTAYSENYSEEKATSSSPTTVGFKALPEGASWVWYLVAPDLVTGGHVRLVPQKKVLDGHFHLDPTDRENQNIESLPNAEIMPAIPNTQLHDRLKWWFPLPSPDDKEISLFIGFEKPRPLIRDGEFFKVVANNEALSTSSRLELKYVDFKHRDGVHVLPTLPVAVPVKQRFGQIGSHIAFQAPHRPATLLTSFDNTYGNGQLSTQRKNNIVWKLRPKSDQFFACYYDQQRSWYLYAINEPRDGLWKRETVQDCIRIEKLEFTSPPGLQPKSAPQSTKTPKNKNTPAVSFDKLHFVDSNMQPSLKKPFRVSKLPRLSPQAKHRYSQYALAIGLPMEAWVIDEFYRELFRTWLEEEIQGRKTSWMMTRETLRVFHYKALRSRASMTGAMRWKDIRGPYSDAAISLLLGEDENRRKRREVKWAAEISKALKEQATSQTESTGWRRVIGSKDDPNPAKKVKIDHSNEASISQHSRNDWFPGDPGRQNQQGAPQAYSLSVEQVRMLQAEDPLGWDMRTDFKLSISDQLHSSNQQNTHDNPSPQQYGRNPGPTEELLIPPVKEMQQSSITLDGFIPPDFSDPERLFSDIERWVAELEQNSPERADDVKDGDYRGTMRKNTENI